MAVREALCQDNEVVTVFSDLEMIFISWSIVVY